MEQLTKQLRYASLITNKDKILFPQAKITKEEVVGYYEAIAPFLLPYAKNHPISMHRFPNGIDKEGFYHKNIPDFFPAWFPRITIDNRDGTQTTYPLAQNTKSLVYLANYGCITPHLWLSKIDKLEYPDRIIFDLDPGEKTDFTLVKKIARTLHEILEEQKLTSFALITGSRGIHVIIPILRKYTFDQTRAFAKKQALVLVHHYPDLVTIETRKEERAGRLFLDTIRNTYGHTAVAPYALRALSKAPVATPVTWQEVASPTLTPQSYTIKTIFKRLKHEENPWPTYFQTRNVLRSL